MKIQLLGTAAAEGWPALFCNCIHCEQARELGGKNIRTRSGALIDGRYKMDFGPDTYHHVLTHGLNLGKVDHLIFTHSHADHLTPAEIIYRFPPYAHLSDDNPETLHIWGNDSVIAKISEATGNLLDQYNRLTFHRLEAFKPTEIGELTVTPLKADHDRSQQCFIYVIERDGKCILYGHDTGIFPDETWGYLGEHSIEFDLVILDCTNGSLKNSRGHMGIDACFEVQHRLSKMGCANEQTQFVATHFSHNGGLLHEQLEEAFRPRNFIVAYDGIVLNV